MVTVSETALKHLIGLMSEENITTDTHYLRVGVKGGGCSGLSYVMNFDTEKTEYDEVIEVDDNLKILIDYKSVLYLAGTELTYSTGLNGKGFEWINPNANRTCGCGESFSL